VSEGLSEGRLAVQGRKLGIYSAGSGAPSVVLIAGGGMPAAFAGPLQARIARFSRVLSYDRAGLGNSDPAPRPLTFEEQARDLRDLLAAAGEPGPFILVAESFGGLVARMFARQFPDAVAGMILVDSAEEAHVFGRLDVLLRSAREQMTMVWLLRPIGLLGTLVSRTLPRSFDAEQRRCIAKILNRRGHWTAVRREADAYTMAPPEQRSAGGFGNLDDLPLTVIAHGKPFRGPHAALEDGWREGQQRLAALSRRGRFIVADRCGHGIAQEDPDLVAQEVRQMHEQTAGAARSEG
jgi:pimeloyl-ACP methyl ester carboxylesterase